MMDGRTIDRLAKVLAKNEVLPSDQLEQAVQRHLQSGESLAEVLITAGTLSVSELAPFIEQASGFPFIDVGDQEIDVEVAMMVSEHFALTNLALPIREEDERLLIAMNDPLNFEVVDELRAITGRRIVPCYALKRDIEAGIRRVFDVRSKARAIIDAIVTDENEHQEEEIPQAADTAPIVKLVNEMVTGAVSAGASDIHIEPQEATVRVRYRIDGILYDHIQVPRQHMLAMMSRLKVMSGLDIAERRRPQDGRFTIRDDNSREFDVRLSIMPTVHGEKACMRMLEKNNTFARIDRIGLLSEQQVVFERMIKRPHGLLLVTGPTGSGKSTTLYAGLQYINEPSININTVEDPVEYQLNGVNQMQVNPKIGVTFTSGLRTLVRQDPDVILVGEIRDKDTAEIAVQAALTGHLVLSTLHTNDAPGALVRLQNMGVEPFLIASAVTGILGQRLLRTVCMSCRQMVEIDKDYCMAVGIPLVDGKPPLVGKGTGCKRCNGRGTRGRTAAVEIVTMNEKLRELVLSGASGAELFECALATGMKTMRQSAIEKVLAGQVPASEIMRVFAMEED